MALIDTPWSAAATVVNNLIDRFVKDPAAAAQEKQAAAALLASQQATVLAAGQAIDTAQAEVDKAEVSSSSKWSSGWRPYVGWACGTGLVYATLGQPLLSWLTGNLWNWKAAPTIDTSTLYPTLFAMLGIATQRTIERIQGVIPPGK